MPTKSPALSRREKTFSLFLLLTALVCGAAVMVVEVMGSRVIGPFFGASLFVWTALIAVTLIALAAGYWLGGLFADKRGRASDLYFLVFLSGVCVLLIPWFKAPVLQASMPLGLRSGALLSALILFGPSLALLGCVSPYLVKIATRELHAVGRTVGGLYSLSTFGSVVGTVLTGFYLIAYLGVNLTFYAVGTTLILLAIAYFLAAGRYLLGGIMLLPLALWPGGSSLASVEINGAEFRELFARDTYYGAVKVVEVRQGEQQMRELLIDGLMQGAMDMASGQSINRYHYMMQFLPYALQPAGRDCLVIGLGAGFIPRWYSERGIRTDVVDIDPLIPQLAREYFAFKSNGDVFIADARHYLLTTERQYDYIILDAYSGDLMPYHLLSREVFALIAQRLRPGGVLGINFIGSVGADRRMTASVIRTLRTAFKHVDVYPVFDVNSGDGVGNLEILAYQEPRPRLEHESIPGFDIHPALDSTVRSYLTQTYTFVDHDEAIVLSDDYNPVDFFDAPLREAVRQRIVGSTSWELMTR